jgi:hypothetical protein
MACRGSRWRRRMLSMTQASPPVRRFGPDFVEKMRRRYGKRPAAQRQLTYAIAVEEEFAPWRNWLDQQLARLPQATADDLAGRLWLDEHFWPVMIELAAGAGLRAAGMDVAYQQEWDGLTPDWTVLSDMGRPLWLVEVHSDNPSRETYGQMRAWHSLVERIKRIPVSVVLTLAPTGGPILPPDARTAKKVAQDLRGALLQPWRRGYITSHGYTFVVQAEPRGGGTMASPFGPHACFEPASSMAGIVSARQLADRVEDKVRKYAGLAESFDVPLVVAVGAHRFTGVGLKHLDDLLAGSLTTTMQFNIGDTWIGEETVDLGRPDRWEMPAELAGVLWVDNQWPFDLAWRANPAARRPAATLGAALSHPPVT